MSAQGTIKRYLLIVQKITSAKYPSFQVLQDNLSDHGFEISPRTLQRNIEQIRHEFGLDIQYDRTQNGYFVDKDESLNYESFIKFLEIISTAELLTDSFKDGKDTLNYISFETDGSLRGIEHLKSLLSAIKNHRIILFNHKNFETGKITKYRINPYLLKEYQNRWYVVGLIKGINEFRAFGIDRIENLEVLTDIFNPDPSLKPSKLFENVVGLTQSMGDPEEVILSFTILQGQYIEALPLHSSQKVIEKTKNSVLVKLMLIPNFEFKQKILMMGDSVKILKPAWLKKEIINDLKNNLKNYA